MGAGTKSLIPTLKTASVDYHLKVSAKFFEAGTKKVLVATTFNDYRKLEDRMTLPQLKEGILQLHVQLGYRWYNVTREMPDFLQRLANQWIWYNSQWNDYRVLYRGAGLDIQPFGLKKVELVWDVPIPILKQDVNKIMNWASPKYDIDPGTNHTSEVWADVTHSMVVRLGSVRETVAWRVSLHVEPEVKSGQPELTIGPVTLKYSVVGFAVNKATLESGERIEDYLKREFLPKLNSFTRRAIETGNTGGRVIVIRGYASKTGRESNNNSLGTLRAQAVMEALKRVTGTPPAKAREIFSTPTEGSTSTMEEGEDPRARKVVISVPDIPYIP